MTANYAGYAYGWDFTGFNHSINCVSFSTDGTQLAAGDDAGNLVLLDYVRREMVLHCQAPAAVTAMLWHPSRAALFLGYGDGGLVLLDTSVVKNSTTNGSQAIPLPNRIHPLGAQEIVEALAFDRNKECLAVALQSCVVLCYISASGAWDLMRQLPGDVTQPRSVHFIDGGRSLIIATFGHGIMSYDMQTLALNWNIKTRSYIGRASICPNARTLVVSNLFDGFDCYSLESRSHLHTFRVRITENVPLPAEFIHNGSDLLFGSSCGDVTIWEFSNHDWLDSLRHSEDSIVQAIAYVETNGRRYIATGLSEAGKDTSLTIWTARTYEARVPPFKHNDLRNAGRVSQTKLMVILLVASLAFFAFCVHDAAEWSDQVQAHAPLRSSSLWNATLQGINHIYNIIPVDARRRIAELRERVTGEPSEETAESIVPSNIVQE